MTLQEIFTKVARHLLTQNEKSVNYQETANLCVYRGANSTSCAVGCLIKNAHYSRTLEGSPVHNINVRAALGASGVPIDRESITLLSALQAIHDTSNVEDWEYDLQKLARRKNLEML